MARRKSRRRTVAPKLPNEKPIATSPDDLVSRLPLDTPPEVVRDIQTFAYSGPLPPASEFARYDQVLPGTAAQIVVMAVTEQKIRRRDNMLTLCISGAKVFGSFVVALALIAAAVYCAMNDKTAVAIVLAGSGVFTALAKAFTDRGHGKSD